MALKLLFTELFVFLTELGVQLDLGVLGQMIADLDASFLPC